MVKELMVGDDFESGILQDIELIQVIAGDIECQNELIETTNDSELQLMYTENMMHSLDIYNKLSEELLVKLDSFMKECKEKDIPINTGYYRIYKVLKSDLRNFLKKAD